MKRWSGVGEAYARSYAALCAGTTDAIGEALGEPDGRDLLDVGAGTGDLAAALAARGWNVRGCEPEPTMRAVAERRHPQIAISDDELPTLGFADATFDAVTANFVLNHVPDPRAAARELSRVAVPGAALVAAIWVASPTWFWAAVCERAGLVPAAGVRLSPDKDFERTSAGFAEMLSGVGWRSTEVTDHTWKWRADPTALWTSAEGGVASAGEFYLSLAEPDRMSFRTAFDALCAEHSDGGSVVLEHTAALAVGQAG